MPDDISQNQRRVQLSIAEIEVLHRLLGPKYAELQTKLSEILIEESSPEFRELRDAYRSAVPVDDELEVDTDAEIALGSDPGAFVMTWTWVPNSDLPEVTCMSCGDKTNVVDSPDGTRCPDCYDREETNHA